MTSAFESVVVLLNFDLVCENALYMLLEKEEFRSSLSSSSSLRSNSSKTLISSSRTGKLSKSVAVAIVILILLRHFDLSDDIGV